MLQVWTFLRGGGEGGAYYCTAVKIKRLQARFSHTHRQVRWGRNPNTTGFALALARVLALPTLLLFVRNRRCNVYSRDIERLTALGMRVE